MGLAACSAPQCPSLAVPEGRVPGPPTRDKTAPPGQRPASSRAAPSRHSRDGGETQMPQPPAHQAEMGTVGQEQSQGRAGTGGGWLELLWCSLGTASSLRSSAPGGAPWVRAQHGGVGWTRCSWCRGAEHSKGSVAEGRAWWRCCTLTCSQKAACTARLPGHPPPRCPACAGSHPRTAKIQR